MTEREIYWTKVEIASQAGQDKVSFDERVQWVNDNIMVLETISDEESYQTAVYNLRNDIVGLISLDAVNQALQLYGVLRGDLQTSMSACVGSADVRYDAYQLLADKLNEHLSTTVFNRDICKKPLMTTLYGKKDVSGVLIENLLLDDKEQEVGRLRLLEEDSEGNSWFAEHVSNTLYELFPLAIDTMQHILDEIQDKSKTQYNWTLPDGFIVKYDVKTIVEFDIMLFGVHIEGNYDTYGANEHNRGLSPNVIHSIDGYIAREVIRKMDGKFITTIHDDFKTLVTFADDLIDAYKVTLCEVLESDMLNDILSQISGRRIELPKTGDLTVEAIIKSEFAIS